MNIQWVGSPNFNQGREGHKPIAIFFHVEDGTEQGTESWFANSQAQVSAHYSIAKDGTIHQYVKEEDEAWAVGLVNEPIWKFYDKDVNPNYTTISIENEGHPEDGFTDVQITSNIWLAADIAKRWNIPIHEDTVDNHQHLCGHYQLDTVNRASCPGDKFPWDKVIKGVQALVNNNSEDDEDMALQDTVNQLQAQVKELQDAIQGFNSQIVPVWAKPSMDKAAEYGILKGDGNGNMMPNAPITRGQFALVLDERFGMFDWKNTNVADWAKNALNKAEQVGLIHGNDSGVLYPKAPITLEQLVVIMDEAGFLDYLIANKNKKQGE